MSKEIYIAGKVNYDELSIVDLSSELENRGHNIPLKWWERDLPKPYLDYPDTNGLASFAMIAAVKSCDVFILNASKNILGAAAEFGAALGDLHDRPNETHISHFELNPA